MQIELFISGNDNYVALLRDPDTGHVALVDAPDSASVITTLDRLGWSLDTILVTHKHHDHIEGIPALVARYGAAVIAPHRAADALPGADRFVREGDQVSLGALTVDVWETPGHCADHVSYHFPQENVIFVGDTLFVMGCGRIFGLGPEVLYHSIQRIGALPEETAVYCGHEYTLSNARFAAHVEPGNAAIAARLASVTADRAAGRFTVPTTIGAERATNVFLRAGSVEEFAARRDAKNRF